MSFSKQELLLEVENLRQELSETKKELEELKEEKNALEIFLEMINERSDTIEEDLNSEQEEKAALEIFLEMANEQSEVIEKDLMEEIETKIVRFMEAVPIGVFVLNAKGKVEFCNQQALQILGKKPVSDMIVEQLSEVYQLYVMGTEQLYPISNLPSVRAFQAENSNVDDIEIRQPNKVIPIELWGVPIYDKKGRITHTITTFQDITDRKQAEKEREQFTRELETLNANLEETVVERTAQVIQKNELIRQVKKQNELIRQVFGRYLSDEIVNTLLETESGLKLGGELREITILTSDIRGFTAQANQLPAEKVIIILNFYLKIMAEVITQYQGTINEFMGDGILVLFGAPILRKDDHKRAVACAVAMQLAMETVNNQIEAWGFAPLEMGIGINTGEVIVGNVGSEKRTQYSAIGNEVNLTYRIESYTVGGQIFISESTFKKLGESVKIRSEKQVKPKGIKQPLTIYEVEGIDGQYNLYLHQKEEVFFPLWEKIPLQYTVLEDKRVVDEQMWSAHLLKVSAKCALIHCQEFMPKPLDNMKINFIKPKQSYITNQSYISEDLYAKVLRLGTQENTLYIHFTSIPISIYKIEWTPTLSINHPIIDEQHQQFFIKFKTLQKEIDRCQEGDVAETIRFLENYATTHFKTEEELMKQQGYPHHAIHQAQHAKFIENLNDFKKEYQKEQGKHLYLALKIQHKLVDWLIHHIGESDQQFGLFLKEKAL